MTSGVVDANALGTDLRARKKVPTIFPCVLFWRSSVSVGGAKYWCPLGNICRTSSAVTESYAFSCIALAKEVFD